eukprot:1153291-Pleurochrysis_carterae.AAC.1
MVDDNKEGTKRLLRNKNREFLNGLLQMRGKEKVRLLVAGKNMELHVALLIVCALACFRICEHLAESGFCICPPEYLRGKRLPYASPEATHVAQELTWSQHCRTTNSVTENVTYEAFVRLKLL